MLLPNGPFMQNLYALFAFELNKLLNKELLHLSETYIYCICVNPAGLLSSR